MIIKGNSRSGASDLARHLMRADTNELVSLLEVRGTVADDLLGCFREFEGVAAGTRCAKPLYHANIDPARDYVMTDAQWAHAVEELETELGLTGQPRAVIKHIKFGREHLHVVWSRVDADRMRAIPDSFNYRKHEAVSRRLEVAFGHEKVQGVHVDREIDAPRPEAEFTTAEGQQAERSGLDPREIKAQVTALWRQTDSAQAFVAALKSEGYVLARGDRRDFVIIDPMGEVHSLPRRLDGVKTAEVRQRLASLDLDALPDVAEAKAEVRRRREEHAPAQEEQKQPQADTDTEADNAPVVPEADAPAREEKKDEPVTAADDGRRADALRAEALASAVEKFVTRQADIYKDRLGTQMNRLEAQAELRVNRALAEYDRAQKPQMPRDEALKRKQQEQEKREALAVKADGQSQRPSLLRRVGEIFVPKMRQEREQKEAKERAQRTTARHRTYAHELGAINQQYDSYAVRRGVKEDQLRKPWAEQKAKLEERNQKDMAQYQKREMAACFKKLGTTQEAHGEKLEAYRADMRQPSEAEAALQRYGQARQQARTRDYRVLNPGVDGPAQNAQGQNGRGLATHIGGRSYPGARVMPQTAQEAKAFEQQEKGYLGKLEGERKAEQQRRRTGGDKQTGGYAGPGGSGFGGRKL